MQLVSMSNNAFCVFMIRLSTVRLFAINHIFRGYIQYLDAAKRCEAL